jgi:NADH-quinone oxidoreductase subunit K
MGDAFYHITYGHFLVLSALLFTIGIIGVLLRRNALIVMMSIEIMLNAGNMAFLAFARMHGDMSGHTFAFIVIAVAAAEAAVGLAIVVQVFRNRSHIEIDRLNTLKH